MSKAAVRLCISAVLLLALASCSGGDQPDQVTVSGTAADAAPSTEDTDAVEQPQAPRENPGLDVPTLPVGGASGVLGSDGSQCLPVSWSRVDIPAGYAVAVSDVTFSPPAYRTAGSGCSRPPCDGYIFRTSGDGCDVPLRPEDPTRTALSSSAVLVKVTGRVLCPDEDTVACADFVTAVLSVPPSLSLQLPVPPQTPEAPPRTDGGSDTTSAPDTSGQSPVG
jgi:hypothetical protein